MLEIKRKGHLTLDFKRNFSCVTLKKGARLRLCFTSVGSADDENKIRFDPNLGLKSL